MNSLALAATANPAATAATVVALAAVAAVALRLEIQLPTGGTIEIGHAILIAYASMLPQAEFVAVAGAVIVATTVLERRRDGCGRSDLRWPARSAAVAAGLGATGVNHLLAILAFDARVAVVVRTSAIGIAYFAALVAVQRSQQHNVRRTPLSWAAFRIHATLMCAAALFVLASQRAPALGLVAAAPLLVLRQSFDRYAAARRTYAETTQALGVIPEVAGLVPLGHAERTAIYAGVLASHMGFAPDLTDAAIAAARLHHLSDFARSDGARIEGLPDLLGRIRDPGTPASIEACETIDAIVRVCSSFDEIIGAHSVGLRDGGDPSEHGDARAEGESGLSSALATLHARHRSGPTRVVAASLIQMCIERPDVVRLAAAAAPTTGLAHTGLTRTA